MPDAPSEGPTEHQIKIGQHLSDAVESFARRHTAGLIFFAAENDISQGSSTCVRIGERFLLATAGHNLSDGLESQKIRVVAPMTTSEEWLPIANKNWSADCAIDVGWIEIPAAVAKVSALSFIDLEAIKPFEQPSDQSLYFAEGLPARLASHSAKTISLASLGYLTIPVEASSIAYNFDPDVDLVTDYGQAQYPLPVPKGMSGGGLWRVEGGVDPLVWSPESSRLVGITRSWMELSKHLIATKIEHWLRLVYQDFSDLRPIIGPVLEEKSLLSPDT